MRLTLSVDQPPHVVADPAFRRGEVEHPEEVFGCVGPRRVDGHPEPLDESLRIALVPRRGEHDRGLPLGSTLLDLAGHGERVEEEQPLALVDRVARDVPVPRLALRPVGMRRLPVPQARSQFTHRTILVTLARPPQHCLVARLLARVSGRPLLERAVLVPAEVCVVAAARRSSSGQIRHYASANRRKPAALLPERLRYITRCTREEAAAPEDEPLSSSRCVGLCGEIATTSQATPQVMALRVSDLVDVTRRESAETP